MTSSHTRRPTRRAFTLAETLLALAMILLLFGAMYAFSNEVNASRKHLESDSSGQRSLTDIFDSIERACLTSVAGDSAVGAGISGSPTSLSIISRAGGQLRRQSWKLDDTTGEFQSTQSVIALDAPASPANPPSENWGLSVASFKVRFLVNKTWQDSFDSLAAGRLPDAIELTARLAQPGVQETKDASTTQVVRPADRRRLIVLDVIPAGETP